MNHNLSTAGDRDTYLENFVADLTSAVYPVALRHRSRDSWVDLELDLWRVLTETVKKWAQHSPRGRPEN